MNIRRWIALILLMTTCGCHHCPRLCCTAQRLENAYGDVVDEIGYLSPASNPYCRFGIRNPNCRLGGPSPCRCP
ncbi:MAG: hypothetical protein ACF8TS_12975 [Maioricimonas sp. JB049]